MNRIILPLIAAFAASVLAIPERASAGNSSFFLTKRQKERALIRRAMRGNFKGRFTRLVDGFGYFYDLSYPKNASKVRLSFSANGKSADATLIAAMGGWFPYWPGMFKQPPPSVLETKYDIAIQRIRVRLKQKQIHLRGRSSWNHDVDYSDEYPYPEYRSAFPFGKLSGPYFATIRRKGRRWIYKESLRQNSPTDPRMYFRGQIELR